MCAETRVENARPIRGSGRARASVGRWLVLVCGVLGACGSLQRPDAPGRQELVPPGAREAALANPADTILRLFNRRSDGGGLLAVLLEQGSPSTRGLAARALGSLPHPEYGSDVTRALVRALERDPEERVRAEAAFALGLRRDGEAAGALRAALEDGSELVRARAVLAASLLATDHAGLREDVLRRLSDPAESVRRAAALAPHRWPKDAADAGRVDEALLAVLARGERGEREAEQREVRWRVSFTLARRGSVRAREAFLAQAHPPSPTLERLFAVQGLAALAQDPQRGAALARALEDPDWRVACEAARGLAAAPDPESPRALLAAAAHTSHHVRQEIAAALGALPEERARTAPVLQRLVHDGSGAVRAAAIEAEARLAGAEAAADLAMRALDRDPFVRAGVARATGALPSERALAILERLARDDDRLVSGAAIGAAGAHLASGGRDLARRALADPDLGRRLAAVGALAKEPLAEDLPYLATALRGAEGELGATLRAQVLALAARIEHLDASELLLAAIDDDVLHVRRLARSELARLRPELELAPAAPARRELDDAPAPDLDRLADPPRVEIVTTRGRMVFELLPDVAPFHVQNFLELARAGHYAGTRFHRVVSDFVVQGGDPRGDGNGATSARGLPLRAELSPLEYERGALGMPRGDDLDGAGHQIFVTHRPTPHLDTRYTLFGRLLAGGDVLDVLDVGDRILEVRLRGEPLR